MSKSYVIDQSDDFLLADDIFERCLGHKCFVLAKPALNRIFRVRNRLSVGGGGGGGGGTPLHKLYWYVPPQRIGFLRCFGLKTGIDFAHFGLASGMVF